MVKPFNNYVLIEQEEVSEKTQGGIYMPQSATGTADNILAKGKILDVSSALSEYSELHADVTVLYNKHSGVKVPDSTNLKLIRREDIYAIC